MAKPKNPVLHAVKLTVVGFALLIVAIVLLALLVNNIVRSRIRHRRRAGAGKYRAGRPPAHPRIAEWRPTRSATFKDASPLFLRLLEKIRFNPRGDRLWLVGDIVNRGPNSLDALRWVYENRRRVAVVLGNHDIHLLMVREGFAQAHGADTLDEILAAPDAEKIMRLAASLSAVSLGKRLVDGACRTSSAMDNRRRRPAFAGSGEGFCVVRLPRFFPSYLWK